jgi:hypothetical protein
LHSWFKKYCKIVIIRRRRDRLIAILGKLRQESGCGHSSRNSQNSGRRKVAIDAWLGDAPGIRGRVHASEISG